ncbi:Uncharacterised protein [Mycobacterium tuberculosis]|uniref:Uncharacterized protein n=1 Tax=Mycobacterium tuberculosis TaxID=1773 RepID=A0A654TRP8_MYCTX|nr:Uncharacterised protein [Mycobacterium tuberculosis]CKV55612.1 Uncharacterised protein [Mycobacterium tuberculosis]COV35827.1 Uncharacterised protein [Mycobacterium tuberculosis]
MRTHQARAELGGHLGHGRVDATPGVVDQVRPRRAGRLRHLRAPGVDTDQLVRVSTAEPFDERHQPRDLGVDVDAFTRAGFDTADVDDVGTVGDGPVDRVSGSRVAESRTLVVKRIRGAVDDRHDQRTITCDWTAAQR